MGLNTIKTILKSLGNPHKTYKCIHVAGTNGKGSIASSLSSILVASGYKVGLFTSPHLVRFNERISVDNQPVSDASVIRSYKAVKQADYGKREPTFFEYSTAMALYEFGRQKVDWAVVETGMGGRLDATNAVTPAVAIISNISLEHQFYLGNTIAEITGEKGGIIKKQIPVVTGVKQKQAISVLEKIAQEKQAPLYRYRKDFRVRRQQHKKFNYYGIDHTWRQMTTGLLGNYQVDNTALILAACEILMKRGAKISLQTIRDGLEQNRWPGRLDVVSEKPLVILDGAHNLIAAKNLARFLSDNLSDRKLTIVTGILDDKPYETILNALLPGCTRAVLTRPKIDRAYAPETLLPAAKKIVKDTIVIPDVGDAVKHAVETSAPEDTICIAGSLYVVGEAKEFLETGDIQFSNMF